ncbi:TlpA disulfide reductase family protein [Pedobacter nyackensis]|uniref:TlpA disulfide reductase family protein n=1 Tax=Pedobacter nyackensis TaxID=475255 RepID=UPI00292DD15A|nr:TlpA disulfide reductase family protein [Pedobacter nyackensis]
MKSFKIINTLALLFFALAIKANPLASTFTITGSFSGLNNGTILELVPASTHKNEKAIGTTTIANGKFAFKGTVAGPRFLMIQVKGTYGGCEIMVENTAITVTGKATFEDREGIKVYNFSNIKVKGSPIHDLYLKKVAPKYALDGDYAAYHKRGEDISSKLAVAQQAKDSVKVDSLRKTDAYKQFEADESAFFNHVSKTLTGIVKENNNSWWGPFFMLNTMSYFTPNENKLFESFSPEAQKSHYGKIVKEELFPEGFIGKQAPLLDMKANNNASPAIAALTNGHKYVLVDFWASWCAPCRKSIPALKKLYAELNAKGLQIVSVSIDKKEADWQKAEVEEQLPWPSFLDKGPSADAWKIKAIPAMFLLNEKGMVVGQNLTLDEVKAKFQEPKS